MLPCKIMEHGCMKIMQWEDIIDSGDYSRTDAYARCHEDIEYGVRSTVWPEGSDRFTIVPESGKKRGEGNGVKPIKNGFTNALLERGWELEVGRRSGRGGKGTLPGAFDCHLDLRGEGYDSLPFVVEWETGNISSSHRAINRIALGILEQRIAGGVVLLPSSNLAPYLTDRIGNFLELKPYLPLWRKWDNLTPTGYLGLVVVEQDAESFDVPRVPKGTDGRSAN